MLRRNLLKSLLLAPFASLLARRGKADPATFGYTIGVDLGKAVDSSAYTIWCSRPVDPGEYSEPTIVHCKSMPRVSGEFDRRSLDTMWFDAED